MDYHIEQISLDFAQNLCREITKDLPEYSGLPEANEHYAIGMLSRISFAAIVDKQFVGLLTLEFPYPENANIFWIGVLRSFHGKGIGHALVNAATRFAQTQGAGSLSVETLSSKESNDDYMKTYEFYKNCGFKPLFDLKPSGFEYNMVYMLQAHLREKSAVILLHQ